MSKIEYYIAKLIAKERLTGLSKEEMLILKNWREKKTENERLYIAIINDKKRKSRNLVLSKIDKKEAYKNAQKTIRREYRFLQLKRWLIGVAAVFIVGLLGSVLIKFLRSSEVYTLKQIANIEIKPGSTRATLQLSNGNTLELERLPQDSLIQQEGVDILHDEKKLDYSKQSNTALSTIRYNTVKVPAGGEYQLVLADGTRVWLNSQSQIKYPVQFVTKTRDVWVSGEACFEVSHSENHPFIVNVNNTKIEVLGTVFNVEAYSEQGAVTTTLARGAVRLYKSGQQVELKPNQQAIVNSDSIEIKEVDTQEVLAWRDGYFYFKKASLSTIMDRLGRWYNVKVFYNQESLQDKRFSVEMKRYESIEKMLEILAKTNKVKFEVKKDVVTVYN